MYIPVEECFPSTPLPAWWRLPSRIALSRTSHAVSGPAARYAAHFPRVCVGHGDRRAHPRDSTRSPGEWDSPYKGKSGFIKSLSYPHSSLPVCSSVSAIVSGNASDSHADKLNNSELDPIDDIPPMPCTIDCPRPDDSPSKSAITFIIIWKGELRRTAFRVTVMAIADDAGCAVARHVRRDRTTLLRTRDSRRRQGDLENREI